MNKTIILKQDKVTKNTVRYSDGANPFPMQIYLQKSELPTPFPETINMVITDKKVAA